MSGRQAFLGAVVVHLVATTCIAVCAHGLVRRCFREARPEIAGH